MSRGYPLTVSDIRYIADRVEEVLGAIDVEGGVLPDDDWRWGISVTIWNEGGDMDDIAGIVAPHGDGYLGFYPTAIKRDDRGIS